MRSDVSPARKRRMKTIRPIALHLMDGFISASRIQVATVVLMIVVQFFSVKALLKIAPIGYLISGAVGLFIMYRNTQAGAEEIQ